MVKRRNAIDEVVKYVQQAGKAGITRRDAETEIIGLSSRVVRSTIDKLIESGDLVVGHDLRIRHVADLQPLLDPPELEREISALEKENDELRKRLINVASKCHGLIVALRELLLGLKRS